MRIETPVAKLTAQMVRGQKMSSKNIASCRIGPGKECYKLRMGRLMVVRLLIQPGDGAAPLVKAIKGAKQTIEIMIFRFNRREIEKALIEAVGRGVFVHALIAYTNRGGEKSLRDLEMRLLAAGATVGRTADDLIRYHAKMMLIDRRELYVLAFNLTFLDMERSRSFGIITNKKQIVAEAGKLFEADTKRQPYAAGVREFLVSPINARAELALFLQGAKRQLLIYDPKVSDPPMISLLDERSKAGVEIKIVGRLTRKCGKVEAHKLSHMRLHTRTIIRDGNLVFIGSQSLRATELDARREVGLIFRDATIAARLTKVFEEDWKAIQQANETEARAPVVKVAKKTAKAVARALPPVAPVLEMIVKGVAGARPNVEVDPEELEETVKDAVKQAVIQAVQDVIEDVKPENTPNVPSET